MDAGDRAPETIEVLVRAPLGRMSDADALESVAQLIDLAADACFEAGITRAFVQLRAIKRRRLAKVQNSSS